MFNFFSRTARLKRQAEQLEQEIEQHRKNREEEQQAINVKRDMVADVQRQLLSIGSMA